MHIKDHATAQGWFRKHAAAPSSVGSWKAFVARNKKVQEPRITAQEPRIGLQGGQLVAPSVDGSRPGYGGDDTVVDRTVLRYKYDKSTKQKLKTIYKNIQKYKDIKTFPTAAKEAEIIERLNNFALDFKEATGRLPVANEIRSFGVASQSVTSGKKGTYLKEGKNFMTETAELLKSKTYVTAFTREEPIVKEVFNLYDEGMSKIAISEKLNVDRTKLRSWFHKWRPEDIGDENKTSGKGKWRPQKKRKKILADLKKELKGMEGGKDILAKMEAHLDDIWNKNDEILAMSDQQILKSKKIKQAMNLNVSNLKIGEGLNYDRYKNLSNADYVAKVRGMAETHQFYQPEHLIAINKKNVASLLPENIVSVSGKIGSQMETLKNYVTKNPKDKFVSQIDELFKSQGIPPSSNIIKLNKVTDKQIQGIEKVFKDRKIPIRPGQAGFIATDILKDAGKLGKKGLRLLSSEWVWPEIVIGWLDKQNNIQKGMSPERASSEMWKSVTFGLRDKGGTENAILGQAKKLGYGEKDIKALEHMMRYGKLAKEIEETEVGIKSMEEGYTPFSTEKGAQQLKEKLKNLKQEQESVAGFYFGAIGDKDAKYGYEIYDQASKELMRTEWNRSLKGRKKRIDPHAGGIGDVVQSDILSIDAWLPQNFLGATKSKSTLAREKIASTTAEERGIGYERVHPQYGAAMSDKQMEPLRDQIGYMYREGGLAGLMKKYYD